MSQLANKRIILGITGGIAAYKSADLVRRLKERGADVRVVMTQGAKAFITPLTLQALSGYPVHDELLDPSAEAGMGQWPRALSRPRRHFPRPLSRLLFFFGTAAAASPPRSATRRWS